MIVLVCFANFVSFPPFEVGTRPLGQATIVKLEGRTDIRSQYYEVRSMKPAGRFKGPRNNQKALCEGHYEFPRN